MPAFKFRDYGTFTGPLSLTGDYNYDLVSFETEPAVGGAPPKWSTDIPEDTSFKLTDLAVVLLNTEANYVGMYCPGVATQILNIAHSTGLVPVFNVRAANTIFGGNVIINGTTIVNGLEQVNGALNVTGTVTAPTFVGALTGVASGNKVLPFDIPHVTQKGKRIRHIIAEGPEAGIYVRGQLKDSNVIELPEYWDGLIDPESITVTLTQIGYSQDLIVDGIEWGKKIKIKSGNGANIHCYYEVWAARWLNPMNHDEKLTVVYEGETPDDYPGGNENFLIGGWDYDRRETQWRSPEGGDE